MATQKAKKESHWLNKSQMAASLGISVQAFDKWRVKPVSRSGREAFYDVRSVLDNRLEHAEQKINPDPLDATPGTIEYERLRLTKEQADNLELKNELARAKVVPIDLFTAVLSKIAAEIAGILDTLPLQIKRKHPDFDSQAIDYIKWHLVKAQNAIARLDAVTDQVIEDHVSELESS